MLSLLKRAPAARIVNLSSNLGSLTQNADLSNTQSMVVMPYSASKAALDRLMLDYAKEFSGTPIKINNVSPGSVATDQNNHTGQDTPERGARIAVQYALLDDGGPTGNFRDEHGVIPW